MKTTKEALQAVRDHVQWCREEGESDLRGILRFIDKLLNETEQPQPINPPEAGVEK